MTEEKQQPTNRFIRSIRLRNILSFGPDSEEIELQPLNVLIGPNASGKSNFIEAISLLKAAPVDLTEVLGEGPEALDWIWKGDVVPGTTKIEATVDYPDGMMPLRYRLCLHDEMHREIIIIEESVSNEDTPEPNWHSSFFYLHQGNREIMVRTNPQGKAGCYAGRERKKLITLRPVRRSILSHKREPDPYPEIYYLGRGFRSIRLFRDWVIGPRTEPRRSRDPNTRDDFLLEDLTNLSVVIDSLRDDEQLRQLLRDKLHKLADQVRDVAIVITDDGNERVCLREEGERLIPATQLSDGTLRYLCLLVILCHPTPPPLICIEEPELGLHPDVIGTIAELLVEASKRTQLIVTTHSEILVSALSETPESVLVCEQGAGGTTMRRLERAKLKEWLKDYSLGDLWAMGEIGGSRW